MPLIRLLLLLLILGSLAIFALQNWSPVLPLVVLGGQTLVAPLAVWVLGAVAAGALTTVVLSGLTATPARRSPRVADRSPRDNGRWTGGWSAPEPNAPRSQSDRSDDWDDRPAQSDWEDWAAPPPPNRSAAGSSTRIQDAVDEDWSNWDGYEDPPQPADRPPRTYETPQEPIPQPQTGSVYSYTYSKPEAKKETIYDAEYRVITPPYYSESDDDRFEPEPPYRPEAQDDRFEPDVPAPPPATEAADHDDWDFIDDDWDTDRDREKR